LTPEVKHVCEYDEGQGDKEENRYPPSQGQEDSDLDEYDQRPPAPGPSLDMKAAHPGKDAVFGESCGDWNGS
jgi:hypothetical protein